MEVSRLGVKSELQLPTYTTATSTQDLSCICNLHHSSQQCRIVNPLSKGRDRTRKLMVPSRIHFLCTTTGTALSFLFFPFFFFFFFFFFFPFFILFIFTYSRLFFRFLNLLPSPARRDHSPGSLLITFPAFQSIAVFCAAVRRSSSVLKSMFTECAPHSAHIT